jgi:hypothetical protein
LMATRKGRLLQYTLFRRPLPEDLPHRSGG